jgi:hypothetical protein
MQHKIENSFRFAGRSRNVEQYLDVHGYIRRRNIEHFRSLLAVTTDEAKRRMLLDLLVEEEKKKPSPKRDL